PRRRPGYGAAGCRLVDLAPAVAVRSGAAQRGLARRPARRVFRLRAAVLVGDAGAPALALDVGGLPVRHLDDHRRPGGVHGRLSEPLVSVLRRPGPGGLRPDPGRGPAAGP